MTLRDDTRGVSIAVNHALSLGITALLITTLLFGAGGLFDRQQERVTAQGLQNVGEVVTTELRGVDGIASTSERGEIDARVLLPNRIGGQSYDIELTYAADGRAVVYANATGTASVPVRFENETAICDRSLNGGPVRIVYDDRQECLTLESANR